MCDVFGNMLEIIVCCFIGWSLGFLFVEFMALLFDNLKRLIKNMIKK